jgi:Acyl-CoA dehydrogenase, C-terminal domain
MRTARATAPMAPPMAATRPMTSTGVFLFAGGSGAGGRGRGQEGTKGVLHVRPSQYRSPGAPDGSGYQPGGLGRVMTYGRYATGVGGTSDPQPTLHNSSSEMIRLLTLKAAYLMDTVGNKEAQTEIAAIKVAAPNIALKIVDRAIQVHGGAGVTDDFPLAMAWAHLRTLRLADGPDEVPKRAIARRELRKHRDQAPATGTRNGQGRALRP